jgi:hypothetical protein
MAENDVIGFRPGPHRHEAYLLGTKWSVSDVVRLVLQLGSVEAAATETGLERGLINTALSHYRDSELDPAKPPAKGERAGVIKVLTEAFGLLAGVTAIVYIAGSIVLTLRLAFEDLPWEAVVAQLPREFVLSTGVGQVLLPALLIGSVYGLGRLLLGSDAEAPHPPRLSDVLGKAPPPGTRLRVRASNWRRRWREAKWEELRPLLRSYLSTAVVMILPGAAVVVLRALLEEDYSPQLWLLAIAFVIMLVVSVAVHELRAVTADHYPRRRWGTPRAAVVMSGMYALAAVPVMMAAASALPLQDAKLCTTQDHEEGSVLVGQSSDRIYLGEPAGRGSRRIAVFPLSQVEELFIGDGADHAACEVGDERLALEASRSAAAAVSAADEAKHTAAGFARSLSNSQELIRRGNDLAEGADRTARAVFDATSVIVLSSAVGNERRANRLGKGITSSVSRLRRSLDSLATASAAEAPALRESVRNLAQRLAKKVQEAASAAEAAADTIQADQGASKGPSGGTGETKD